LGKAVLVSTVGRESALAAELTYVRQTLPVGITRNLREAVVRRDVDGLKRAGAIVAGFSMAAAGFLERRARTLGRDRH